MSEKPIGDREILRQIEEGQGPPPLTEEQLAFLRSKYQAAGVSLEREADLYDHFTPDELISLLDALHDDADSVSHEHAELLIKFFALLEILSLDHERDEQEGPYSGSDSGEIDPDSDEAMQKEWERLEASLNAEGFFKEKDGKESG